MRPRNGRKVARAIDGARYVVVDGIGHDLPEPVWRPVVEALTENMHLGDVTEVTSVSLNRLALDWVIPSMTTTTERNSQPTRTELVDSAMNVRRLLRKRLADGDIHRRQADDVIDALTDAGLFRLNKPRRFGGHPVDLRTVLQDHRDPRRG